MSGYVRLRKHCSNETYLIGNKRSLRSLQTTKQFTSKTIKDLERWSFEIKIRWFRLSLITKKSELHKLILIQLAENIINKFWSITHLFNSPLPLESYYIVIYQRIISLIDKKSIKQQRIKNQVSNNCFNLTRLRLAG